MTHGEQIRSDRIGSDGWVRGVHDDGPGRSMQLGVAGGFLHAQRRRAADEERQMTYVAVIGGFATPVRWPCCFEKI